MLSWHVCLRRSPRGSLSSCLALLAALALVSACAEDDAQGQDTASDTGDGTTLPDGTGTDGGPGTTPGGTDTGGTDDGSTGTGGGTGSDTGGETSSDTSDGDEMPAGEPLGLILPRVSIEADELGVIINTDDPLSTDIADAYVAARGIPDENVLELAMGTAAVMSADDFAAHETAIAGAFGDDIQAIALTSMTPYRIDCMGVSAAVALGFDTQYCQAGPPCLPTAPIDYFGSLSTRPWTDHGVRPTMILAAESMDEANALIERGVQADATRPMGEGWYVRTTDEARSVRWPQFTATVAAFDGILSQTYVDNSQGNGSNLIENETDILFYFTGLGSVGGIDTNEYLPGAMADHLTSFGGQVPTSGQMSIIEWIKVGATASYGTAVEPCNYTQKFPDTEVAVPHYFRGETVVEAYWKSVHWPGEGNFVGEPLARPWLGADTDYTDGTYTITTTLLTPGQSYDVEYGPTEDGPWYPAVDNGSVPNWMRLDIEIPDARVAWYRIVED